MGAKAYHAGRRSGTMRDVTGHGFAVPCEIGCADLGKIDP
jgi:hypothetical protein